MKKKYPHVVIIGRTNAGKSTLFNRLSSTSKAIVSPLPNTTRDRNSSDIVWKDKKFTLIDTGGLDTAPQDELGEGIQKQVAFGMAEADVILFIIDGLVDILPQDKELAMSLHKLNKPVVLGINKIDNYKKEKLIDQNFYQLNFNSIAIFSALNGARTGDLLDLIVAQLPEQKNIIEPEKKVFKLAIIGRPNVGKSSLINAILGEEKVLVSPIAHTTRDINDIEFFYKDHQFILIDTAGLRRKSLVGNASNKLMARIEKEGVHASIETMKKADVVAIIIEAQLSISAQDQALVDFAMSEKKNLLLVINKWDLIPQKEENTINDFINYFDKKLPFAKWVPMIFVSALTRQRVKKILDLAIEINHQANLQISEEDSNQLISRVLHKYKPKQRQTVAHGKEKKDLRINYFKQIRTNPPVFFLSTPKPKNMPSAIVKIIEKELRNNYEFLGVPVRIVIGK